MKQIKQIIVVRLVWSEFYLLLFSSFVFSFSLIFLIGANKSYKCWKYCMIAVHWIHENTFRHTIILLNHVNWWGMFSEYYETWKLEIQVENLRSCLNSPVTRFECYVFLWTKFNVRNSLGIFKIFFSRFAHRIVSDPEFPPRTQKTAFEVD